VKLASVVPAPSSNSLAKPVVAAPLLAVAALPVAERVTSSGLAGSRPPYSRTRTSAKATALSNLTVTVLAPAPAAAMFLA
jgi:hypothetical protein